VHDVDLTAAEMLGEVLDDCRRLGVELHLSGVGGPGRDVLDRAGLLAKLNGNLHPTVAAAATAVCVVSLTSDGGPGACPQDVRVATVVPPGTPLP
jgi:hypothetical protein